MQYDWILFDADDTLFFFDAFAGLKLAFNGFGVDFTEQDYDAFQAVNKPLWEKYQNGEIDADTLKEIRFQSWADRLNVTPALLNSKYQMAMAQVCRPFDGVKQVLEKLSKKAKLGIITNGFAELQQIRLQNTRLSDYFEFVVVSEIVGLSKPHIGIFEHAFSLMGEIDKKRILMVGDNPASDIQGGVNAGIDSCWIKLGQEYQTNLTPTFIVKDWFELEKVLLTQEETTFALA